MFVHLLSFSTQIRVNEKHLTDVLHNESSFLDGLTGAKSPPFIRSFNRVDISVLMKLEPPIATSVPNRTNLGQTILVD